MKASSPLWVGSIKGLHAVFDLALQSNDSRWVLLYLVVRNGPAFYRRSHARAHAKKHSINHAEYQNNIERYKSWREQVTDEELSQFSKSLEEKDLETQAEIEKATKLHEQFLATIGAASHGVEEPRGDQPLRQTYCMNCQHLLSSDTDLQCVRCSYLACPKCGACGC
jgi:hypothetical protein